MPSNPLPATRRVLGRLGRTFPLVLSATGLMMAARPVGAQSPELTTVRSRQMELQYRLIDAEPGTRVLLWYTRDRGATWQSFRMADAAANPIVFHAPAEGLYGFLVAIDEDGAGPTAPPAPGTVPQRWVFVDYTPPLAQWDDIEPGDAEAGRRNVQLRWTAYDDHLAGRPVALAVQSSVDGHWRTIDSALPNTGRFDWTLPADLTGQLSFKMTVTDQGGHAVERVYGPLPADRWINVPAPTTRPAPASSAPPTDELVGPPSSATQPASMDMDRRLKAQDLLRQGEWNVSRGQYAVAVERFREALDADPELLPALANLANIYYLQQDYSKAVELYDGVLSKDARNLPAMRGAALAYVAMKQYPQSRDMLERLLSISDQDAQAWLDLGDVRFMMGDTQQARGNWNRAIAVDASAEAVIRKAKRRLELYGAAASE